MNRKAVSEEPTPYALKCSECTEELIFLIFDEYLAQLIKNADWHCPHCNAKATFDEVNFAKHVCAKDEEEQP